MMAAGEVVAAAFLSLALTFASSNSACALRQWSFDHISRGVRRFVSGIVVLSLLVGLLYVVEILRYEYRQQP